MPHFPRGTDEQWQAAMEAAADRVVAAETPAAPTDDRLRVALLTHHPIMRSETGPLSGCRCGAVGLGQDVIAHVVGELRAYGDLRAAEELRAALHVYETDRPNTTAWLRARAAALTAREEAGR